MSNARKPHRRRPGVNPQVERPKSTPDLAVPSEATTNDTEVITMQAHLDLVHALIGKLTAERDAAYQNGWADAQAAFGIAA